MGILALALAAGALGIPGSAASAHRLAQSTAKAVPRGATVVTVGRGVARRSIPKGFLGLSFEYWAVNNYAGRNPNAIDPVLVQLIRNLTPGQEPILRIGGVTTDWTWWPVAGVVPPGGVNYTLNLRRLLVMSNLAQAVGGRLILGLNLEADNRRVATAEARAMLEAIGPRRIEAFELGNEPELYSSFPWYQGSDGSGVLGRSADWGFSEFNRDFARIAAPLGRVPLAGPTVGGLSWVHLDQFVAAEPRLAVVTLHRYPLWGCFNQLGSSTYPTIENLLSEFASRGLADSLAPYAAIAHAHGLPLRNDEMNSVSCGNGNRVANVFGSALWALDALFEMARAGVDGVNIHTAPTYPDRLFKLKRVHSRWRGVVEPEYYGLLMFAQAAPPGSRLLDISAPAGSVRAWATKAPSGQIHVVLINDDTSHSQTLAVRVAGARGAARLARLQAPSVLATRGVTLGGQSFGARTTTGVLSGRDRTIVLNRVAGDYVLRVPAGSAAMLTLPAS